MVPIFSCCFEDRFGSQPAGRQPKTEEIGFHPASKAAYRFLSIFKLVNEIFLVQLCRFLFETERLLIELGQF